MTSRQKRMKRGPQKIGNGWARLQQAKRKSRRKKHSYSSGYVHR